MRKKEIKSFTLELKDMNDTTGEVVFGFSSEKKDLDKDIMLMSAYSKTLSGGIGHIYHNRDHEDAVGKPSKIWAESGRAWCASKLAIKTINGNDCYEQYKAGIIKGHSQEFETIISENDPSRQARVIKEVKLWGVTSVTNIPANLDTPTLSIKSASEIAETMESINNLLHKGNISDPLGEKFLKEYKKLEEFVEKNKAMVEAGLPHCDSCKAMISEEDYENDSEYKACGTCGKFINKVGAARKASMITDDMIKSFRLS